MADMLWCSLTVVSVEMTFLTNVCLPTVAGDAAYAWCLQSQVILHRLMETRMCP
jgi:hypothetical protein